MADGDVEPTVKYVITGETLVHNGKTLKRIARALSNNIVGSKGGWIESVANLNNDPEDTSWVSEEAKVHGNAVVEEGGVLITGNSDISGNCFISGGGQIDGNSVISGNVKIIGINPNINNCNINDDVYITGSPTITNSDIINYSQIGRSAIISDSVIKEYVIVEGNANVSNSIIEGTLYIFGSPKIKNSNIGVGVIIDGESSISGKVVINHVTHIYNKESVDNINGFKPAVRTNGNVLIALCQNIG